MRRHATIITILQHPRGLYTSLMIAACSTTGGIAPLPAGGKHILFVGNSLTYVNDLPATVASIAASAGDTIRVATAALPDAALIDHLNPGSEALAQLRANRWDYVVLQQGPTTAGPCRDTLVLAAVKFAPLVHAAGGQVALFMTWPGVGYQNLFDETRVSFQAAANAAGGVFLPAGHAWRLALQANPGLNLYGSDGYHPSPTGSFLAALEIYERLSGRDVRTLPAVAFLGASSLALDAATVRRLQAAAHSADSAFSAASVPTNAELSAPSQYVSSVPRC